MKENKPTDPKGVGHAFPHMHYESGIIRLAGGLSKREYFAALALQGSMHTGLNELNVWQAAEISVAAADALIAALEKQDG